MAVPAYKRNENKLDVLNIAMAVFEMAVSLVKNDQLLSKKNYKIVAEPMMANIRNLMYKMSLANNIFVKTEETKKKRLMLQLSAREYAIQLQVDVQLIMKLSTDQKQLVVCNKLIEKIDELKTKIAGWIKYTAKQEIFNTREEAGEQKQD